MHSTPFVLEQQKTCCLLHGNLRGEMCIYCLVSVASSLSRRKKAIGEYNAKKVDKYRDWDDHREFSLQGELEGRSYTNLDRVNL